MKQNYNGGISSYAIWVPEMTKFIELYQSGKSIDEIEELSDKDNVFQMSTPTRARRCSRNLAFRIKLLPESLVNVYNNLNVTNKRIISLLSLMLSSRLLDEFMYEVYRPKVLRHEVLLQDYEVEAFINQKRIESSEVNNWSLNTQKRVKGAIKTFLRDAGLMKIKNRSEDELLCPIIDSQVILIMKTSKLDYEIAALGVGKNV